MADHRIVHRRRDAAAVVSKACAAIVALAALVFGAERAAAAPILLEIDATNPNAVVFTATSAAALVSRSGEGEAIRLGGSLIAPSRRAALTSGDFRAAQSNYRYGVLSDSVELGLRLTCCGNQTQTFVAGQQAFFGSSVFDLEPGFSLVTSDTIGSITISDANGRDTGIVLGQYRLIVEVPAPVPVPAPPSLALVVGGLALMGFALRRRRAA